MSEPDGYVTIKDIAKACGVSPTTVSLALRNHPRISEKTKNRVKTAAEKLGYRRNPLVAALMSNLGRSHYSDSPVPLAAVYNNPKEKVEASAYHQRLWEGILSRASKVGFSIERYYLSDAKIASGQRLSEILYARGVSGVLIPPLAQGGGHLSLDWDRFSAVAIGYSMLRPELHRVCPDQYQGIRLALHHARRFGYKHPGLIINGFSSLRTLHLRSSGFYGYEYSHKTEGVIPVLECGEVDLDQLSAWYDCHRPDVIISSGTDRKIWQALQQTNLKIPDDVGFVTLSRGDMDLEVAGINENEDRVGSAAVDLLAQLLYHNEQGIPAHPRVTQIAPSWEGGKTCVRQH